MLVVIGAAPRPPAPRPPRPPVAPAPPPTLEYVFTTPPCGSRISIVTGPSGAVGR
jgi:hypothetical protein